MIRYYSVTCILFALVLVSCGKKPTEKTVTIPKKDSVTIKIIFAGDLMGHMPWINSGKKGDTYNYDTSYTFIKPYIEKADFAMLNLETTLNGPPYKGYPMFTSPDELARDAKKAGFDFFALANNHCIDRGKPGVKRTLHVLDSLKIPHTGIFNDTTEYTNSYPPVVDVKGVKIAILNYTYSTNGLQVFHPNVINMIDSASVLEGIKLAKAKNPDLIVSVVHWGNEYSRHESDWQVQYAQLMANNGVDIIFGAHPHVIQPVKTLPSKRDPQQVVPVFYSVGNFISNQDERYRNGGMFAEVTITKVNGKITVDDYAYLPFYIRQNKANRSYVAIPLNNWETRGGQFKMTHGDSLLAAQFLADTKELIGPDVKMSR